MKMDLEEWLIIATGITGLILGGIGIILAFLCHSAKADESTLRSFSEAGLPNLPLRYLIGANNPSGRDSHITVVPYDSTPVTKSISVAYGNLLDETNSGKYSPYLKPTGTSREYKEGLIDPHGPGFLRNLTDQLARRKTQGFRYIELDNPDSYGTAFTLLAVSTAHAHGFGVLAKNPLLLSSPVLYLQHPAIVGAIVEREAGDPVRMEALRRAAKRPAIPIWFVSYGNRGLIWARSIAIDAMRASMGVTHSPHGEYTTSNNIVVPK